MKEEEIKNPFDVKAFIEELTELRFTPQFYYTEEWEGDEADIKQKVKEKYGELEEVDAWGGEGEGDKHGRVIFFTELGVYLRADGWYTSYDGASYEEANWYQVTPKQQTITVYERV